MFLPDSELKIHRERSEMDITVHIMLGLVHGAWGPPLLGWSVLPAGAECYVWWFVDWTVQYCL